jgi:hypothetical protein
MIFVINMLYTFGIGVKKNILVLGTGSVLLDFGLRQREETILEKDLINLLVNISHHFKLRLL